MCAVLSSDSQTLYLLRLQRFLGCLWGGCFGTWFRIKVKGSWCVLSFLSSSGSQNLTVRRVYQSDSASCQTYFPSKIAGLSELLGAELL